MNMETVIEIRNQGHCKRMIKGIKILAEKSDERNSGTKTRHGKQTNTTKNISN